MVEVIEVVEVEVKDLDKDIADLEKKLNSMSVTTSVSFQRIVFSACVSSKNKYWLKLFCINGAPEENKSKTTFNKLVIWKQLWNQKKLPSQWKMGGWWLS